MTTTVYYLNLEAVMEDLALHYNEGRPLIPAILRKDGSPAANCTIFKNDAGRKFYILPTQVETKLKTGFQQINAVRYDSLSDSDIIVYFIGHCSVFYAFTKAWLNSVTTDWEWQHNISSFRLTLTGTEDYFEVRTTKPKDDPFKPYKHKEFVPFNIMPE